LTHQAKVGPAVSNSVAMAATAIKQKISLFIALSFAFRVRETSHLGDRRLDQAIPESSGKSKILTMAEFQTSKSSAGQKVRFLEDGPGKKISAKCELVLLAPDRADKALVGAWYTAFEVHLWDIKLIYIRQIAEFIDISCYMLPKIST
jgi:hypothetical protein